MSAATKQEKASTFATTCNRLSQFIKGKGSLGDLGLEMAIGKNDTYRPPTTMNLLPGVDASGTDTGGIVSERNDTKSMDLFPQAADNRKPESTQLTIFYGGKVMVFDNFPANKANDLMMLAGKGCNLNSEKFKIPNSNLNSVTACTNTPVVRPSSVHTVASDLPIARKASLHRFLEKRKDRINAKAPYQINQKKESVNKEENQPWLALTPTLN